MEKAPINLLNTEQHFLTLRFEEPALEAEFDKNQLDWARRVCRITVIGAVFAYVLWGLLDIFLVSPELSSTLWLFRGTFAVLGTIVIWITFTRLFKLGHQPIMMVTSVIGYISMGICMYLVPPIAYAGYYVALVLVVVFCFLTMGLLFKNALIIGAVGLVSYVYVFCYVKPAEITTLIAHLYFLVTAVIISAAGAFNLEQGRRQLFLREQRVQIENRMNRDQAALDSLTGLASRSALEEFLEQIISADEGDGEATFSACAVDLKGFRRINNKLGRARADLLLQTLANRFMNELGSTLIIARLAGDEFLLVESTGADATQQSLDAAELMARIEACANRVLLDADAIYGLPDALSTVSGCVVFPYPGCTAKDVLRRADQELARKKYLHSGSMQQPFERRSGAGHDPLSTQVITAIPEVPASVPTPVVELVIEPQGKPVFH